MIIQTTQIVVIIMICHSHSLPFCFVIYSIHVLDFKQPGAVYRLLGLTLKISLKLQKHLESWKTIIQEKFSEHNERCEVTEPSIYSEKVLSPSASPCTPPAASALANTASSVLFHGRLSSLYVIYLGIFILILL